jgi:hypothetical protein
MPLEDLSDIILGPDDEPPNRARKRRQGRVERLRSLPGPYVRVPIQWLCKPCRDHVFRPKERLFLYVLYRSHWGQRGVALTDAVIAEIGISRWNAYKILERLERKGWLRVERQPGRSRVMWPAVLAA